MIVETEIAGPVRNVLLNRPEKRNALNGAMIQALEDVFSTPPGPGERLAVIRAAGPVFCAGLDLSDDTVETNPIEGMLHKIETYPLPVVAVVQGDAIAGGNELALHCDLVVASSAARFGMSLSQIGLVPSWFLIKKLLEVAGPVITRRILLLGDPMPAHAFHEYGLISHIAAPEELDRVAGSVIDRLAANAPLSLKAMKALIVREMTFRDRIPHEDLDGFVAEVNSSADAKEGMAARLAKRPAHFQGALMSVSAIEVKRLVVPKASDVLAEHLRESILRGELPEGSPLPTERELGERSGLSRASVREALRILESEGLIQTRPGRNGGASVKQPTAESIARSVELYIRGRRVRLQSLLETREAIEPAIARLAAVNRNDDDLARLSAAQARLTTNTHDRATYLAANVEWHMAVALASHNEPLIGFMTAISDVIHSATELDPLDTDEVRGLTIAAHERIYAAIAARDGDAAERRMARHVGAYGVKARGSSPAS